MEDEVAALVRRSHRSVRGLGAQDLGYLGYRQWLRHVQGWLYVFRSHLSLVLKLTFAFQLLVHEFSRDRA